MRRLDPGFTLIELMVAVAIFALLAILAIPSFIEFRERIAVRGAGDQMVSFWANARLEAVKRNQNVTVSIRTTATTMCLGASTTGALCRCFDTAAATDCNVAQYPGSTSSTSTSQPEWHGVTVVGTPDLGSPDSDADGMAIIDPKRGYLATAGDVGGVTIKSPGANKYRLRLYVDRWARPYLCVPTNSPRVLSDYSNRTCAP
jgi:prepilin-type N-terminal cleavage/methylation domain-containing protein